MKRREDESFEEYKHRRKIGKIIDKVKRVPRLIWNSNTRKTFEWGRDELPNSFHELHKRERIQKKLKRKIDRIEKGGSNEM